MPTPYDFHKLPCEGRLGTRFGELAHPYYSISPQNIHYFGEMSVTAVAYKHLTLPTKA